MKFDESFFIGLVLGIFVLYIFMKIFDQKSVSTYTVQDFPASMSAEEAATLLKTQTTDIGTELALKLNAGMSANMSKEDMIKLTWQYADASNELNKKYAAYRIMNAPTPGTQAQTQSQP